MSAAYADPSVVRTLPRPRPEHVTSLALEVQQARELLATRNELEILAAEATLVLLQNALVNLGRALESRGSVR